MISKTFNDFEELIKADLMDIEKLDLCWILTICLATSLCDIPEGLYGIRNQLASDFSLGSRNFTSPQKPETSRSTNSSK